MGIPSSHVYRYLRDGAYRELDCSLDEMQQRRHENRASASAIIPATKRDFRPDVAKG